MYITQIIYRLQVEYEYDYTYTGQMSPCPTIVGPLSFTLLLWLTSCPRPLSFLKQQWYNAPSPRSQELRTNTQINCELRPVHKNEEYPLCRLMRSRSVISRETLSPTTSPGPIVGNHTLSDCSDSNTFGPVVDEERLHVRPPSVTLYAGGLKFNRKAKKTPTKQKNNPHSTI